MIASASALPTRTLSNVMYRMLGSSIRRSYAITGMPASLAFWRAGRIALLSCARRTRTFAPCEMRLSTSVSCCSELRLASALMYLPPAASTVDFRFGSSCAAQRGCWKLFHETPTVQPAPPDPPAATLAPALAAVLAPALAPALAPPPLEHAAATTTSAANSDAILRFIMGPPPSALRFQCEMHADVRLGYHPLFGARPSGRTGRIGRPFRHWPTPTNGGE